MAQPSNGPRPVASVARALALLEELRDSERGLGVNELARRIGVNASTASRLLSTLESAGMVQRNAHGPYRLGLGLVSLADRVLARLDVQALARPLLVELMERTGETATLSLPGEREAITVDSVPSRSSVVSMARLGRPSVSHATAVGKVMLAFGGGPVPPERDLVAFTDRTITDRITLATEIEAVRDRGYGTVFGEREVDVNAIAAPVFDRAGSLAAILGIQGPAARLKDPTRQLPIVLEATTALTRGLGGARPRSPDRAPSGARPRSPGRAPSGDRPRSPDRAPSGDRPRSPDRAPSGARPRSPDRAPSGDRPPSPDHPAPGDRTLAR